MRVLIERIYCVSFVILIDVIDYKRVGDVDCEENWDIIFCYGSCVFFEVTV